MGEDVPVFCAQKVIVVADNAREEILSEVNFSLHKGDWVAVVGRSGSGKSTLAKVLAEVRPLTGGSAEWLIEAEPKVQLVLQNPESQMVGETVYEDICFGMENYAVPAEEMAARARRALEQTGLAGCANVPASRLSGGQKQLLAIAGAICLKPSVLVLDEATSMLDPASRERILSTVRELHRQGTTVVWVTQLLDELAYANRVVVLEKGKLVYEGSPREFFYGAGAGERKDEREWTNAKDDDRGTGERDALKGGEVGGKYGEAIDVDSPCEQYGLVPPYTVQVAKELCRLGCPPNVLPLTPEEFGELWIGEAPPS